MDKKKLNKHTVYITRKRNMVKHTSLTSLMRYCSLSSPKKTPKKTTKKTQPKEVKVSHRDAKRFLKGSVGEPNIKKAHMLSKKSKRNPRAKRVLNFTDIPHVDAVKPNAQRVLF
jgi:hypothetical protein